jgi:hypothetical protein
MLSADLSPNGNTLTAGGTAWLTSNGSDLDLSLFAPSDPEDIGTVGLVLTGTDADRTLMDVLLNGGTITGNGQITFNTPTPGTGGQETPEPAALALWGVVGAAGLWRYRRMKRAAAV